MAGITLMFLILFRNTTLSFIGVVPNFMAAFLILGIIGLLGIPLDMMTITIAAITIGIAVDNSIHYIYRFKEEFSKLKDYNKTLKKCHDTVGVAILNTSITIVFGFSILVLSNFIPTIYFGIFTGIAMLLAMISVLTLLPKLILTIKPFGNEWFGKYNKRKYYIVWFIIYNFPYLFLRTMFCKRVCDEFNVVYKMGIGVNYYNYYSPKNWTLYF